MTVDLSALDETFLELEDGDPAAHMHLGAVLVLDPPRAGTMAPESVAAHVRSLIESRLPSFPRLTERLATPVTGEFRRMHWVSDERFDLDRHLRRAALPVPGDRRVLDAWSGEFFGQRLDRRHPLWEIVVLEGLADGRWALATKLHHCLADGIGSLGIAEALFAPDDGPGLDAGTAREAHERSSLARIIGGPLDAATAGLRTIRHPRRVGRAARSALVAAELVVGELTHDPLATLVVPLGIQRRFATVTVPLQELQEIERGLGGTINDAVLAAVCGGLRRLLLTRGEPLPARGVRAMVPVDRRDAQTHDGNRISSLFVDLPVAIATTGTRHSTVHAAAAARKRAGQAGGSSAVLRLAELVPPVLHRPLARLFVTPRLFDLTVTNVAGPQEPLRILGCTTLEIHPLVPLAPDHALGVAVLSHAGAMTFGVVADFDGVPDLDEVVAGIRDEHAALHRLAIRRTGPTSQQAQMPPTDPDGPQPQARA